MTTGITETYRVTAGELRQFCEQFERLESEKKDIAEQQKEIMAGAKARGYDIARIKDMIKLRAMDPDKRSEMEAVNAMYAEALGM